MQRLIAGLFYLQDRMTLIVLLNEIQSMFMLTTIVNSLLKIYSEHY